MSEGEQVGGAPVADPAKADAGRRPQYVVGIGSSAGGLEALEGLVGMLEPEGHAAFVIAQHLAPEHPSLLTELLTRGSRLRVATASDGLDLETDLIAIAPPGQDIRVEGAHLRLSPSSTGVGSHPSIDLLLESIADEWGDHGVGVILSGTGSDGAYGMRRIKASDGLTIVQAPKTAKFEAMPLATLALGMGDLVLAPAEIGARLSRLGTDEVDWLGEVLPVPAPDALTSVVLELRRTTGVDFSRYKESTLLRQVKRRMAILQVAGIDDYLPLLMADQAEPAALMNGLLVTVTSFFRDPGAFEALREHLGAALGARTDTGPLRIWVPGCATGEEVYSIAMIASDLLGNPADLEEHLKVFGTDLDEAALTAARRGLYPSLALGQVPPTLGERYLRPNPQGVEVVPELRAAVVFARHNVGQDPPFPRLDLISCRNTLIYFTAPLQRRVLEMFAYALMPGGLLFLGASESLASDAMGFEAIDPGHRVFARTSEPVPADKTYVPGPVPRLTGIAPAPTAGRQVETHDEARLAILDALAALRPRPCLVLNERHEVVEVIGDVLPYCRIAQGRPSTAATSFLRPELGAEARALLLVVRASGERVPGQPIDLGEPVGEVRLVAGPLPVGGRPMTVLEFFRADSGTPPPVQLLERAPQFDAELDRLERELLDSQDTLQGSLADLETAHEELLASNEELQASSEELQSSYEELSTSNEELQASNEELATTNRQLRQRTEELDRVRLTAQSALEDHTRVTDALTEVVWQRDTTFGRLLYVSGRIHDLTGWSPGELGNDASVLDASIDEADRDRVWAARSAIGRGWSVDYRIRDRDGVERWVAERGSLVRGIGGADRLVGTLTDITDQLSAIRREGQQRQVFEAVFRSPYFGIAILDAESRVVMANDALCELLGYDAASIVRMPLAAFAYPDAPRDASEAPRSGDRGPEAPSRALRRLVRRGGTMCWANLDVRPLPEPVGEAASMVVVRDVTDLHEQSEEMARRSAIDSATGLLNREHFRQALGREIARCREESSGLALVWVDVDVLKDVNDRHGHAMGDVVLRAVADRIESGVRPSDAVGRIGGDEFGVIISRSGDVAGLESVLDRLLVAIRQPVRADNDEVVVTASIGVAVFPGDGVSPEEVMRAADTAMFSAKERGGDTFEYYLGDMTRAAEQRRALRSRIDRALAEHEFEMYYQPIVQAASGQLWGVEALIRWNRDGGVVPAAEFIDFCETTGQIRQLAPVTLTLFRRDLELLRRSGTDIGRAAINLSVSQLEDRGFSDLVDWWPSPSGLTGVVVEVTESVFLPDHEGALSVLAGLVGLGAEVSVDDFGSGYSNLSLLGTLAPSYIKLDRTYLAANDSGRHGNDLLAAAIQMAHAMDAAVVAEGIETEEQVAMLTALGADLLQGYAIAMPMPRQDLVEWLRGRS